MMNVYELDEAQPTVPGADGSWIAPGAIVAGKVTLGQRTSVWFNAVVRADDDAIHIGEGSNVQDAAVLHCDKGFPLYIGAGCTIGHSATIHGCTIGDNCLIGIGAVVLNGAKIGHNTIVGANALITENKVIPDNSVVMGTPGKVVAQMSEQQKEGLRSNAAAYVEKAQRYRQHLRPLAESSH